MATELKQVARTCNEIAEANGFERPSWDNIVVKLALAGTELDEARDGVRGVGADPIGEELADVAIRLLSALDAVYGDGWCDRVEGRSPRAVNVFAPIEVLLWVPLGYLFKAMEHRRRDNRADVQSCMELALLEVWHLADALRVDLQAEIAAKCEKNRRRPYLHGKGYAVG